MLISRVTGIPGVLVVWREPRRVRGLGDLAFGDFLQRVGALAVRVESVHEVHGGGSDRLCDCWMVYIAEDLLETDICSVKCW